MKLVSWNVNGIRAAWNHGLSSFLDTCEADIYAFQEIKTDEPFPMVELEGYYAYWCFCESKKGYSGTMCLSKWKPLSVRYELGDETLDGEGRIITLEYEDFYLVNCYVPNPKRSEERYDYRNLWDSQFRQYLYRLRYRKPTIVCGDFNVTVADEDIYEESIWQERNAVGFQSTERECLKDIIENGFVDTYRLLHPQETGKYTWWSNRRFKRKENRGWRLDYFLVSEGLKDKVRESTMLTNVLGSDHCPILLEIDLPMPTGHDDDTRRPSGWVYTYEDLLRLEKDEAALARIRRSDLKSLWESIDWERAEKHLEDMQMALAKSAYTRKLTLIFKWQRIIIESMDAKLLAVRQTCRTAGGPGVDGVVWDTEQEKMSAALSLFAQEYKAMPARLLLLTARNGKERNIHVDTYFDRAMQCLCAYALDPIAESWADRASFAYRKGRSPYDMNEHIKSLLSGEDAPEWVFIADIRKCYDHMSHEWIMTHIPMPTGLLRQFLTAGYVFGGELFPKDVGIGIGCPLSPIVANMVLDGLQAYIYSRLYPDGTEIDYLNGNILRFADDIIITARTESTAMRIQCYTEDFLDERGLMLAAEKSRILNVREGFTFMARTYTKQGTQVFARPSDRAVERFMSVLRETIEDYNGSQQSLIEKLNHKIDGWSTYHKTSDADEAFRKLDVYINALLLKLCESKHPQWPREKILDKYWYVDGAGRYCYALPNKKETRVKFLTDTLLVNYRPVRLNFNPYINQEYLEQRTHTRKIYNVTGTYRSIWNRQEGKCYYCGNPILQDEEKELVEAAPDQRRLVARMAYVHKRCTYCSFESVNVPFLPASINDVMVLLEELDADRKPREEKHATLAEFFRTCDKKSVTLTFKQIEALMGDTLGTASLREGFWYQTSEESISSCWLEHGYEIKHLYLEGRRRVQFVQSEKSRGTACVNIPEVLKHGRIPGEAKYELENYFRYIIKKYGL